MRRLAFGLAAALAALMVLADVTSAAQPPVFKLGFKALADQIPEVVGQPLEDEHWGGNGDSLQQTTTGLMVWRKADNWTAFTNGNRTWLNGPTGVQDRANHERFEWESDTPSAQQSAPVSQPQLPLTSGEWRVCTKSADRFQISIPAAWTEMVAGSGPPDQPAVLYPDSFFVFGAFDAAPRARGESYGYVLVDKGEAPAEMASVTLEDAVRGKIEELNVDPLVAKPVSQRRVPTKSGEAAEIRYHMEAVIDGNRYTAEAVEYLYLAGRRAFMVSGIAMGDSVEGYLQVFERIGREFEILGTGTASPVRAPVTGGPFTPDVKAMDPQNAGPGASLKELVLEVDKEWAGSWGWRPQRPVTVYLYADPNVMAEDSDRVLGGKVEQKHKEIMVRNEAATFMDANSAWAVLVSVKGASWGVPWEQMKARHNLLHEYSLVMTGDIGARDIPIWFAAGIAEYNAFAKDPEAVAIFGRVTAATGLFNMSLLPSANPAIFPSLRQLTPSYWVAMEGSEEGNRRSVYGIAYQAVKYLISKVGTERLAQVLRATASNEGFDAALQRITGYTVDQLDAEYRTTYSRAGWVR